MQVLIHPVCAACQASAAFSRAVAESEMLPLRACGDLNHVARHSAWLIVRALLQKFAAAELVDAAEWHANFLHEGLRRADEDAWVAATNVCALGAPCLVVEKESIRILIGCKLEGEWPWEVPATSDLTDSDIACDGSRTAGSHVWEYSRLVGLCVCMGRSASLTDEILLGWLDFACDLHTDEGDSTLCSLDRHLAALAPRSTDTSPHWHT
jgi:hypothetical protein